MKKKIDFSNVETFQRAPEGTHTVKIASVEEATFQSGNEGFKVAFEITKGAGKGARVYDNFPLAENSLWKLKTLLESIGIKCDGRIMLDTDKMEGKLLEVDVYHEEYEGKMRARLGEMRKLVKSKAEDNDEDEDEDFDEDFDEEEEEEEEEKPKKKTSGNKKSASKTKKKPEPEEDDDEDEEDEEEEEKPAKKTKKSSTAKSSKKTKKEPDPEPEEDEDWEDDDEEWEDA